MVEKNRVIKKEKETTIVEYFCINCKERVFENDNYCSECGVSLN